MSLRLALVTALVLAALPGRAAELGEERAFWVEDRAVAAAGEPTHFEVQTTLRGLGEHVLLYVADDSWGATLFHEQQRDYVVGQLETATPLGAGGAYGRTVALFGEPSDVDADGHVVVVAYAFSQSGHPPFTARFEPYDVLEDFVVECVNLADVPCANEAEVLFVDVAPAGSAPMLGRLLGELQRVIHLRADPDEGPWLVALMSALARVASGHADGPGSPAPNAYLADHGAPLVTEADFAEGGLMLFGLYLHERFGAEWIRALVEDEAEGFASFEAAIAAADPELPFGALFGDFAGRAVTAMPEHGGAALGNLSLNRHDADSAFPVPSAEALVSRSEFTVGPTSWRWFGGPPLALPEVARLEVRAPAEPALELRGFTLRGVGAATTAQALPVDETGALILEGNALWQRVVVTVANPGETQVSAALEVTRVPAAAGPEPVAEPAGEDAAEGHGEPDLAADLPVAVDVPGETPKRKGGGSCAAGVADAGPWPLLVLLFLLFPLITRRRRAS